MADTRYDCCTMQRLPESVYLMYKKTTRRAFMILMKARYNKCVLID